MRAFNKSFSICFILLFIGITIHAQTVEELFEEIKQLQTKKQHRAALLIGHKVIAIDPNNAVAYNSNGNSHWDLGQLDSAVIALEKAIELNADYSSPHYNLGGVYTSMGKLELALRSFKNYSDLEPSQVDGWIRQGLLYAELGKEQSGLKKLNKALLLDSTSYNANYYKAFILSKLKQHQEALIWVEKAIQIDSTDAYGFMLKANVYSDLNRFNDAVENYNIALAINPKMTALIHGRMKTYLFSNQYEKSIEDAKKILAANPKDLEALFCITSAYFELGEYENTITYAQKGRESVANGTEFLKLESLSYARLRDFDKALKLINQAIAFTPDIGNLYRYRVDILIYKNTPSSKYDIKTKQFIDIKSPQISTLNKWVKDRSNPYFFKKLNKKFNKNFDSMSLDEIFMLYYGYSEQKNYTPYTYDMTLKNTDLSGLLKSNELNKCIKVGKDLLEDQPFIIEAYLYVAIAYYRKKDFKNYQNYITKYHFFLQGIIATGSGLSYDDAYIVASISDEYNLLYYLDYSSKGQSLKNKNGHHFDVLKGMNEMSDTREFYFNIDKPFESLNKSLFKED